MEGEERGDEHEGQLDSTLALTRGKGEVAVGEVRMDGAPLALPPIDGDTEQKGLFSSTSSSVSASDSEEAPPSPLPRDVDYDSEDEVMSATLPLHAMEH
jgi:hypothetical protein